MAISYNPVTRAWNVVPERTNYRTDFPTNYETNRRTDFPTNLPTNTPLPELLPTDLRYDYPTSLRTDYKTNFNTQQGYDYEYLGGKVSIVPSRDAQISLNGRSYTGVKASIVLALKGKVPSWLMPAYVDLLEDEVREVLLSNEENEQKNTANAELNTTNARTNEQNRILNDQNYNTNLRNAESNIQIEAQRFEIQQQNEINSKTNADNAILNQTNAQLNREGTQLNAQNAQLNSENTYLNKSNTLKNEFYNKTVALASSTKGGDYVIQRDKLNPQSLIDAGMKPEEATALVEQLQSYFKTFYQTEKLVRWDTGLGAQPPYGAFDPDYYKQQNPAVAEAYAKAVANDDIDITERYGEENYYLQHYTSTGKAQGLRGNPAEDTIGANTYTEEGPTDADIQVIRDKQFGVNQNTLTQRLLNIPEVANEWAKARNGDPYWTALAKEKYLDPSIADEFSVLFRLSERPEDKQVIFNSNLGVENGITELEDAISAALAQRAEIDTKKFASLSQNILKDTIAEMKRVKGEQEMLSFYRGFSGFSEVVDINRELTNSILGDSGVGGMLSFTSGGEAEESLLGALQNVTGMRNNITYNWQQWFDKSIKEKYGIDYLQFEPLEEKKDIINAFLTSAGKIYDETKGEFSQTFLDKAGFKTTESLVEFLEGQGEEGLKILGTIQDNSPELNINNMEGLDNLFGANFGAAADYEKAKSEGFSDADIRFYLENVYRGAIGEAMKAKLADPNWGRASRDEILLPILSRIEADINVMDAAKNRNLAMSFTLGDKTEMLNIDAQFARDYIDEYLIPRFDTSRSMDEFVEYLDVRQGERNPFQTDTLYLRDSYDAMKALSDRYTQEYLDNIKLQSARSFDPNFYFNPTGDKSRELEYAEQKKTVEEDWEKAKAGDEYWATQAYRFGVDVNNQAAFARMHFELKGQGKGYDAAEDIINASKVQDFLYGTVVPVLKEKAFELNSPAFGQFITPEEFADELLEGVDPLNSPEEWDKVLKAYGIEDFKGTIDELKSYIIEALRTGSAQDIREQIKYLNEKRQKPTQEILGVTYIERPEDYKDEMAKPTTELYAVFQKAGYQGTEDEFYEKFFPDLDRSEQILLTKSGRDEALKTYGLDLKDPFASLSTIEDFFPEYEEEARKEAAKEAGDSYSSYFRLGEDDEDTGYKSDAAKQFLGEFTSMFKGL